MQGLLIRRPNTTAKDAALCARIRGKLVPVTLIRGNLDDITAAHRELCQALHTANTIFPAKLVRAVETRTQRPMDRVHADAAWKSIYKQSTGASRPKTYHIAFTQVTYSQKPLFSFSFRINEARLDLS